MVNMNPCLREELEYRRFVDSWQVLPRRHEKHFCWSLSTDASGSGWGCVLHLSSVDQVFRDIWNPSQRFLNISTKEMLALVQAVERFPDEFLNVST